MPQLNSWLDSAELTSPRTSNQPALTMPFQRWFKFKEAFSPSFVVETLERLPYRPESCLDPFSGSGTTALTCQFLGIKPVAIEVNPFMADVIEAKLTLYDSAELRRAAHSVLRRARRNWKDHDETNCFPGAPNTFVEPGNEGRWIFNCEVAKAVIAIRSEIEQTADPYKRFLRVMLGSNLVELSNVRVNGKGRRYRSGWKERAITGLDVFNRFESSCSMATTDIESFCSRRHTGYKVLRGDARELARQSTKVDFVLTSPPYPNSFDYTDIYNIELWALGYLASKNDSYELRKSTLRSHVQIAHHGDLSDSITPRLKTAYRALAAQRKNLWNPRIPEMVCQYFDDMRIVLQGCKSALTTNGHLVMAVGDSRYAGVYINVAKIITEIGQELGFQLIRTEAVRSMRTSAQQGGRRVLKESLVWFSS
jgi:site-specific DNA-adenine methylase